MSDFDGTKSEEFRLKMEINDRLSEKRRKPGEALSFSDVKAVRDGAKGIRVSGQVKDDRLRREEILLTPDHQLYELADECIRMHEAQKQASGQ